MLSMRVPIKNTKPVSVIRIAIVLHSNRRMQGADLVEAIILRPLWIGVPTVQLLRLSAASIGRWRVDVQRLKEDSSQATRYSVAHGSAYPVKDEVGGNACETYLKQL
jgi:hypothetical protein